MVLSNLQEKDIKIAAKILKDGGIGVMPTDTLYGIVGSALNPKVVEKIYQLRKRDLEKPMIVLISSLTDLKLFNIKLKISEKKILKKIWPGKVSVVLSCPGEKFRYLHRGKKTLAFRFPRDLRLLKILKISGPLVAPSANLEGMEAAKNIMEAQKYFAEKVDFYLDGGDVNNLPSTLIMIKDGIKILRAGEWVPKL